MLLLNYVQRTSRPSISSTLTLSRLSYLIQPRRPRVICLLHTKTDTGPFNVLFFGRDEFSCTVMKQLHHAKDIWQSLTLVTHPDEYVGRRRSQLSVSPLKSLGEELGLTVATIPHHRPGFRTWNPPEPFTVPSDDHLPSNHVLITASFGRILSKTLLNTFHPHRRLNVHPSLLPAYRGAAPIQHALLRGEKETGVSVISMLEMKEGIDTGDIWGSRKMPVPEDATFHSLRDSLAIEGGNLLVSVLRDMRFGKASSIAQSSLLSPDSEPPIAPLIAPSQSFISFTTQTAQSILRHYRSISHHKPLTIYTKTGRSVQLHNISEASFSPSASPDGRNQEERWRVPRIPGAAKYFPSEDAVLVRCKDMEVVKVKQLKTQDRNLLGAKAWWNGILPEWREGERRDYVIFSSEAELSQPDDVTGI